MSIVDECTYSMCYILNVSIRILKFFIINNSTYNKCTIVTFSIKCWSIGRTLNIFYNNLITNIYIVRFVCTKSYKIECAIETCLWNKSSITIKIIIWCGDWSFCKITITLSGDFWSLCRSNSYRWHAWRNTRKHQESKL